MSEYSSTRGAYADEPRSYSDVLLEGLAPDRGLYVPTEYPSLTHEALLELNKLNDDYRQLFVAVKSHFVGESMTYYQQERLAESAYTTEKFSSVENNNFVPLRQIGHNLFIQNLSLGPTAAFKDMAMQALGQDMQYELNRRGEHLTILGATSGDTGSSAEAALAHLASVNLFMLSPQKGMSEFQRAQMAQLSGENIHNIAIEGSFDDCQDLVKDIKMDPEFAHLGAVNSINWARVASQVPYYFAGYLQAIKASGPDAKIGDWVDFVAPSGNMGNALAGYIARKMGLPIRKIIIATNENDVLHHLIQDGVYTKKQTQNTSSPSMDIPKASNYERVVHDMLDGDSGQTSRYMEQFEQTGTVSFEDIGRNDLSLRSFGFDSGTSNHDTRIKTIRRLYQEEQGIIDPHTADGVSVALGRGKPEVPTICLETALSVKFSNTIKEAIGKFPPREERFRNIELALKREFGFVAMGCDVDALKDIIRRRSV